MHRRFPKPSRVHHSSEQQSHPTPSPSATTPSRTTGSRQQPLLDSPHVGRSPVGPPTGHQQEFAGQASSAPCLHGSFQRSKSLFCLSTEDPAPASSAVPQWFSNTGAPGHCASEWRHNHLLSVDDLDGAQETDVDTGLRLSSSDLSVVSAYSAPSRFCSALETPLPPGSCGSHWSKHKSPRGVPLSAPSAGTSETSHASLPFFTKGPSSYSATAVAVPPAPGATSLTGSPPELPGDAPNSEWTGRDVPPPTALAGPGDDDAEEFYI